MITLDDWSVVYHGGPYEAPEQYTSHLSGRVYGHPGRHEDGKRITTSAIIRVEGKKVWTASGSLYTLGEPSEDYVEWCKDNSPTSDLYGPNPLGINSKGGKWEDLEDTIK